MSEFKFIRWDKSAPPDEEETEANVRKEGYEPIRWTDPAGSNYPRHRHEVDELIWVLQGQILFNLSGQNYLMNPGDRMYLPKGISHSANVSDSSAALYFVGQKRGS